MALIFSEFFTKCRGFAGDFGLNSVGYTINNCEGHHDSGQYCRFMSQGQLPESQAYVSDSWTRAINSEIERALNSETLQVSV